MELQMALALLGLVLWQRFGGSAQELDPSGRNVCLSNRVPVCCSGWRQEGTQCTAAVCEGADACKPEEVCVRPGVCRCKPGFFGANCNSHCPSQYWGSDCKELCMCHPNGKCDPVTGQCTCNPNRWGPICQFLCQCGPHGHCNPLTGSCQCEPGWWSSNCKKQCQCNPTSSRCHPATGQCTCAHGWWGHRCGVRCLCNHSPCTQSSGKCECQNGWWGQNCERRCDCLHGKCNPLNGHCDCNAGFQGTDCSDPCTVGFYGLKCRIRCGRCRYQPCSPVDGFCPTCDPGWNGTRCDQPCLPGYHGENCAQICPSCRQGEVCEPETGSCQNCDPGRMGPSCDSLCPPGRFGDRCVLSCPDCGNGSCSPVSGECVCDPGYWGDSCNETCPRGLFGVNCSSRCECRGASCSPYSGECEWDAQHYAALIAGILLPLLLLFCLLCCCFCCRSKGLDAKDRAADGGAISGVKHHFQGVLANLSSMFPCASLGNSRLPWVTVSHHDAEIPFNHSFIESPSTGWDESSFASFDSDEGDPVYCIPPREDVTEVARGEYQEISSKCNVFHDSSAFNEDDISEPFSIPRTSSNAKAKRPSVSFAEGTKFAPECRRGSTTDTPNLARKPKIPWGLPKLSSVESQSATEGEDPQHSEQLYECAELSPDGEDDHKPSPRSTPGGRRRTLSNAHKAAHKAGKAEDASNAKNAERKKNPKMITIYMSVGPTGKPSKPSVNIEGEGHVQSVLRRFGSFQRAKLGPKEDPKLRNSVDSIQKPARRRLLQAAILRASSTEPSNVPQDEGRERIHQEPPKWSGSAMAKPQDLPEKKAVVPNSCTLQNMSEAEEGAKMLDMSDPSQEVGSDQGEALSMSARGAATDTHERAISVENEDSEPKYENVSHADSNQSPPFQSRGYYALGETRQPCDASDA